jgi:serine/threonine-protein kinase
LDLDPGTVVANRYRISRPLGRGGMGEVFAAENIRTGRPVAIKLLRQDSKAKSSAVARFRQEARAAGSINSDHVTQVLDVEEDPEHGVVLVFELLEGESLIDRLKRTGPISFDELWSIIEQVWMGLADAHRAGIIHRDLKPSNVFLERRPDGTTRVKILDFGISKVPKEVGGETLTEMGQSLGTFSFMPPEQIGKAKTVDHRADIYACATLIYQSLTGQLPYNARNILVMVEMKSKTDARRLADATAGPVDPRLDAFVARGLAREPAQRFQTALEALEAWRELRPQGKPDPVSAPGSAPPQSPSPTSGQARSQSTPRPHQSSSSLPRVSSPVPPSPSAAPVAMPSAKIGGTPAEGSPLPRLHNDLIEMTTDETAATLAMPMANIKKGHAVQAAPPLAPRLDSATASIGTTGAGALSVAGGGRAPAALHSPTSTETPVGPGGTQPVVIGRALDHLSKNEAEPPRAGQAGGHPQAPSQAGGRPQAVGQVGGHSQAVGNLPPHPAGYYLPAAVQASLARGAGSQDGELARAKDARASLPTGASGLPRAYDDSSPSPSPADGEVRTQVLRPEDTGKHGVHPHAPSQHGVHPHASGGRRVEPSSDRTPSGTASQPTGHVAGHPQTPGVAPVETASLVQPKRGASLLLVLIAFVVVGFVVVAGAMKLFFVH